MTAGGEDKVVRVFDVRTGKVAMQLPEFSSRIRTLVHEPLSKSLSVLGSSSSSFSSPPPPHPSPPPRERKREREKREREKGERERERGEKEGGREGGRERERLGGVEVTISNAKGGMWCRSNGDVAMYKTAQLQEAFWQEKTNMRIT
jgi:hypothetical protein